MSVKELKKELEALSPEQQAEVAAYLFHLRHVSDSEYQSAVQRRLDDKDKSHWLTPDEFEKQLDRD